MDTIMLLLLGGCVGLVIGWMVLPAPKFVQDFWVRMGWAEKAAEVIVPAPARPPVPPVSKARAAKSKRRK